MEFAENFLKYPAKEKYGYVLKIKSQNSKAQNHNSKLKTIIAENIELGIQNTKYQIQDTKFQINLPGEFNIENALAATCVGFHKEYLLRKFPKRSRK